MGPRPDPCPLTPEQRAAYRDWQVREVLRRREASRAARAVAVEAVRALDERAKAGARGSCPACGRPYGRRVRCYTCRPGGRPRKATA